MMRCLLLVALCLLGVSGEGYEGFKVYSITPKTSQQSEILKQLHDDPDFDFFKESKEVGHSVDVMVAPQAQEHFEETLKKYSDEGLEYSIVTGNVQKILDQEFTEMVQRNTSLRASSSLFNNYHSHNVLLNYLHRLEREYPHIVRLESIGRSYEGRDLLLIHIGTRHGGSIKPTIFIDAGIHAREWIATPSAMYIINQLVENPQNHKLIDKVNWAIIPAINPDGYEFSRSSSSNRLWRKTRSINPRSSCIGVDPNRNFGHHWMQGGASNNPCSDTYAGTQAFSEPETNAVRQFLLRHAHEIKMYLTIHSYGNYILYPWGYTSNLPHDNRELQNVGQAAARAIQSSSTLGSRYTIGSSTNVLYVASGGSDDWAKGVAGIDLSYCFELPGGGTFGFNPPANMIIPIVQETFEGFKTLGEYVAQKWN